MATKGLGNETLVTSILRSNTVLVEVGGSVRRITIENFMNAINNGDEQMLRQVAWGIPIKQSTQSSTNYGVIQSKPPCVRRIRAPLNTAPLSRASLRVLSCRLLLRPKF